MDLAEIQLELERCHRDAFGWALSCCLRDVFEAENVLQAAYLKILEGKARFDGRSAFRTWLFSVIRRTAAESRRRRFWERLRFIEEKDRPAELDLNDVVMRSELRTSLVAALSKLSRRQREVLQLVFYHELSISDAAVVMGVRVGSARTHYERGKRTLRDLMIKEGGYRDEQPDTEDVSRDAGRGRLPDARVRETLELGATGEA